MHSSRIGAVHFAQGLALNETAPLAAYQQRQAGLSTAGAARSSRPLTGSAGFAFDWNTFSYNASFISFFQTIVYSFSSVVSSTASERIENPSL